MTVLVKFNREEVKRKMLYAILLEDDLPEPGTSLGDGDIVQDLEPFPPTGPQKNPGAWAYSIWALHLDSGRTIYAAVSEPESETI